MTMFVRLFDNICPLLQARLCPELCVITRRPYSQTGENVEEGEFRVLSLVPKKEQRETKRKFNKPEVLPPRANQLSPEQDWSDVWVGPRSFHPAVVPLPIRQGYAMKGAATPGKYANAELMKIPNFLHLTPPAVKKHCKALKKFCTPWPEELDTNDKIEKHFPLEVISSDYCHSSPTIRDTMARIVTIRVKVKNFCLDDHAKDKLQRLVQERYNSKTDVLTIAADRCPLKKQNYEYAMYLLTAVVHESAKFEEWEKEKTEADMEYYRWETNASRSSIIKLLRWPKSDVEEESGDVLSVPFIPEYRDAVSNLWNEGENEDTLSKYKEIMKKIFSLPDKHVVGAAV